ncbi:MAG TPA: sigma-70 family RNA polymerase sigma factor [Chloroflexota bacterium]|nr:sigma-70 family RNA polymerase sigma factor [Chloroflexota bacterium]
MVHALRAWDDVQEPDSDFDRLFLREYRRVAAIAYRIVGDADEAEDVAQDVFCSFYRRHDPAAPYAAPWLYRAAAHTALNAIRGKRRRSRREQLAEDPPAVDDDPQQLVVDAERRREVRAAMARLSERSASVLALRYSGLSYGEVAEALGVKIGQVGTLLRRAEAALKKELDHDTPR